MVHRAIFGSVELFLGVLVESYVDKFPLRLTSAKMFLLHDTYEARYTYQKIADESKKRNLCVDVGTSGNRHAKIVYNGQKQQVPLLAVVGAEELEDGTVSVRSQKSGELSMITVNTVLECMLLASEFTFFRTY